MVFERKHLCCTLHRSGERKQKQKNGRVLSSHRRARLHARRLRRLRALLDPSERAGEGGPAGGGRSDRGRVVCRTEWDRRRWEGGRREAPVRLPFGCFLVFHSFLFSRSRRSAVPSVYAAMGMEGDRTKEKQTKRRETAPLKKKKLPFSLQLCRPRRPLRGLAAPPRGGDGRRPRRAGAGEGPQVPRWRAEGHRSRDRQRRRRRGRLGRRRRRRRRRSGSGCAPGGGVGPRPRRLDRDRRRERCSE